MPMGKGTYGSKVGRPKKKKVMKVANKKKMGGRMGGRSLRECNNEAARIVSQHCAEKGTN